MKIGADCVISSSRTALHVGALFLRNRHPSNASSLRLSPRGLTTLRGPRSSIRQYAGVLFLVIIRFSLAEKSCGVFAREKWRQRKRGAVGRLAPVNATRNVGRYLCPQKPYVLLLSEGRGNTNIPLKPRCFLWGQCILHPENSNSHLLCRFAGGSAKMQM